MDMTLHNSRAGQRALLCLLMLLLSIPVFATEQADDDKGKEYAVTALFKKYGRHPSTSLVRIKGEVLLKGQNQFSKVRGIKEMTTLTLKIPTQKMASDVAEAIERDKEISDDIQEVYADGYLISAYYRLGKEGNNSIYLLYRYDLVRNRIALIYMTGEIDSRQLLALLHSNRRKQPN